MEILIPVLLLSAIGLAAGILLTAASHFFAVETDPTADAITQALPGANCGGCGFAGCADYAAAIAKGRAAPNLCKPGGSDAAAKIGAILGEEVTAAEPMVMVVHCRGDRSTAMPLFRYTGVQTCLAAKKFYGGSNMCTYGCLGFGDCASVCEEEAICIQEGLAHVIPERCIACGKCAKVCPNGLLSLRPAANPVAVSCSSRDTGKRTRQVCQNGCIGCGLCEKHCPNDAVKIRDLHAVIDYTRCTGCGACAKKCPTGAIRPLGRQSVSLG
ncbi:MAG: RnfABCDGE type electron transport complex subunit B [Oscillospiraceae bacterium]|nr:RnfABCDGE type electron transport complex subunit B [Oscillospiraceae bacterium]